MQYAQPALVALEYSLACVWIHNGLLPGIIGVVSVVSLYNCVYYCDTWSTVWHVCGYTTASYQVGVIYIGVFIVYMCVYVCICVYMCVYVCICVYMCVYVCICSIIVSIIVIHVQPRLCVDTQRPPAR
jgi:hypothetical protein